MSATGGGKTRPCYRCGGQVCPEWENVATRLREAERERDEARAMMRGPDRLGKALARVRELEDALREWLTADPHKHDWLDFEERVRALLGPGETQGAA